MRMDVLSLSILHHLARDVMQTRMHPYGWPSKEYIKLQRFTAKPNASKRRSGAATLPDMFSDFFSFSYYIRSSLCELCFPGLSGYARLLGHSD